MFGKIGFQKLFGVLFLLGAMLAAAQGQRATYTNPVQAGDYPDPSVIRVGRDYWATATTSQWAPIFPLLHSTDLMNWQYIANGVDASNPLWSTTLASTWLVILVGFLAMLQGAAGLIVAFQGGGWGMGALSVLGILLGLLLARVRLLDVGLTVTQRITNAWELVGPDGAAWVTDGGLNAIVRVDPKSRRVRRYPLPASSGYANLNTAVFDRRGVLWFTGQSGIGKSECVLDLVERGAFDAAIGPLEEILSLTKMNWNQTQLDGRYPITMRTSRVVGKILKYVPPGAPVAARYANYM